MSKFFINRPIVAMVISIVLVLVGSLTILSLPVAQFPNIAPPEVQICPPTYVGADAADSRTIPWPLRSTNNEMRHGVDNIGIHMYSLELHRGHQTPASSLTSTRKRIPNNDFI